MKTKNRVALGVLLAAVASLAWAKTFQLFSPATGVLKGDTNSYITTAAASIDIRALWSGTCDATTFLRGDGACAAGGGGGSVTSVGLSMPTGFSVANSPVTGSDTLAVTTALSGPLRGNGSGFLVGDLDVSSEVTGVMDVANGGTGAATLTGLLVGNGTSAIGAAASADVISLWSGTCDSTTFLRADGACTPAAGVGVGTVTSVAMTVPSGLSVAGSPITTSGSLDITTTLDGPLRGDGSGFTTGNLDLASEVTGVLPVANGGTGAATLTGVLKGNGTSAFDPAASADIIGLWSGTCNASAYLRGDGACAVTPTGTVTSVALTMPGIFSVGGSPITSSGTLAVTASGTSGGVPYFSGTTTLASSALLPADRVLLGGGAGNPPKGMASSGTTTTVLHGKAGIGEPTWGAVALATDVSGTLPVANGGTGTTTSTGTGSVVLSASPAFTGSPTVSGQNICRADGTGCPAGVSTSSGSGSVTLGDCTVNANITINYRIVGNMASIWTTSPGSFTCTSNTGLMSFTTLPVAVRPTTNHSVATQAIDSGSTIAALAIVQTSGAVQFDAASVSGSRVLYSSGSFTASGSKGLTAGWTITYPLD